MCSRDGGRIAALVRRRRHAVDDGSRRSRTTRRRGAWNGVGRDPSGRCGAPTAHPRARRSRHGRSVVRAGRARSGTKAPGRPSPPRRRSRRPLMARDRASRPEARALRLFGAFANERRGRVLWAGLDDEDGRLARIAASLDEGLSREFAPEKRAFTPHLTVARFEPPAELQGLEGVRFESDPFDVDRIVLYRSHLRRPAPFYERLETF